MRRPAPGIVLAVIALAVAAPAGTAATATPEPLLLLEPALDPANATVVYQPGVAYVGRLVQTGLWRTDDAGATFRPIMLGPPTTRRDAKPVAVAVGADGAVLVAEGEEVRRSTDGGASFTALGTVPGLSELAVGAPPALTPFAVVERDDGEDGESSDRRLAGVGEPWPFDCTYFSGPDTGRQGVWRLSDGVWTQVLVGDISLVRPHPTDPRRVYAVELCGVYRSDDGGATFRRIAIGGPLTLVVHPLDPERLLAADELGAKASADGGATWSATSDPKAWVLAQPGAAAPERVVAAEGPTEEDDPVRLLASDDFGRSWRALASPGRVHPGAVLVSPADPQRLYAATFLALLTSADGGASWSAHGLPLDQRGPRVELQTQQAALERTAGGRLPARVRVGLRVDAAQVGYVGSRGRLVIRQGGRARTIGRGQAAFVANGRATMTISLLPGAGRLVRAAGRVDALLRVQSGDDVGDVAIRWERLTLTG